MSSRGLVLALMLILVLFVPGVYAIGFSLTGCGSEGRFSDETNIIAPKDANVFVHSTLNKGTLAQDAYGSGNLHKSYVADNGNGEIASITADIYNARQWYYFSEPTSTWHTTSAMVDGSGYGLTAIDAEKIKCAAAASNRFEDKASVGIEVYHGSLINYEASAYAQALPSSDHSAFASQKIGSSWGKNIVLNSETSDAANHESEARIQVRDGSIANYDSEAACSKTISYPNLDLYAIHGAFTPNLPGYISGKAITSEGTAIGPTNLKASYKTTIKDGSIIGFFDQGTQLINDEVIAISLEAPANWEDWHGPPYSEMKDNIVIAKKIEFESSASDGLGEKSSESTVASNVFIRNWLGSGSFASPGKVWVQKDYEELLGRKVVITP